MLGDTVQRQYLKYIHSTYSQRNSTQNGFRVISSL